MYWLILSIAIVCYPQLLLQPVAALCSVTESDSQYRPYVCDLYDELAVTIPTKLQIFGDCLKYFEIRDNRKLHFRSSVDRELFANYKSCKCQLEKSSTGKCMIKLPIQVNNMELQTLPVYIIDVNDNSPEFHEKGSFVTKIRENERVGAILPLPAAVDRDIGETKTLTYTLDGPNATCFQVNFEQISNKVFLKSLQSFDREKDHWLKLTLVAQDEDGKQGKLDVRVEILEVNDNSPRFDKTSETLHLREDTQLGNNFHTVMISDKDAEQTVKLYISKSAPKKVLDTFSVSTFHNQHMLRLIRHLDYDEDPEDRRYVIPLIAEDSGNPPLSSTASVTVIVQDVNDNSPLIQSSDTIIKVEENKKLSNPLVMLTISDKDSDSNSKFDCNIKKSDSSAKFTLTSGGSQVDSFVTYRLYSSEVFDREKASRYNISVLCQDRGVPSLTSSLDLAFIVLDVNDEAPKFNQTGYTATIRENMRPGSPIINLKAFDNDLYPYNQIIYSIPPRYNEVVINSQTGEVSSAAVYDREKVSTFTFECIATDARDNSKYDKTTVNVKILDQNDNAPYFEKSFNFNIRENSIERFVGSVSAKDNDSGENADIVYYLKGDNVHSRMWKVKPNGDIHLKTHHSLDRESQPRYELYIEARDKGNPSQSSTATVQIIVDDENDNEPIFTKPSNRQESVNVTYDTELQAVIYRAQAEDKDAGENARIVYSLNEQTFFVIDASTGDIRLNRSVSREKYYSTRLTITARDNGSPRRSSTAYLTVNYITNWMHKSGLDRMVNRYGLSREIILGLGIGLILIILLILLIVIAYFCLSLNDHQARQANANKYSDKCSTDDPHISRETNNRQPLSLLRMLSKPSSCLRLFPKFSKNSNIEDVPIEEQKNSFISKPVLKHHNSGEFVTSPEQEAVLYTHLNEGTQNFQLMKGDTTSLTPYGEWASDTSPPSYDRYWIYGNDPKGDPFQTHRTYTKLTGSHQETGRLFSQTLPAGMAHLHSQLTSYANKSDISDHPPPSESSDELKRIMRFPVTCPPDSTYTTTNTDSDFKLNYQDYSTAKGSCDNPALQSFGKNIRRGGYVVGSPSFTSSFV